MAGESELSADPRLRDPRASGHGHRARPGPDASAHRDRSRTAHRSRIATRILDAAFMRSVDRSAASAADDNQIADRDDRQPHEALVGGAADQVEDAECHDQQRRDVGRADVRAAAGRGSSRAASSPVSRAGTRSPSPAARRLASSSAAAPPRAASGRATPPAARRPTRRRQEREHEPGGERLRGRSGAEPAGEYRSGRHVVEVQQVRRGRFGDRSPPLAEQSQVPFEAVDQHRQQQRDGEAERDAGEGAQARRAAS